jgi:putative transposase
MDFFTVPTLTFGVLYCFFVISHDRRRILYLGHPPSKQCLGHTTTARSVLLRFVSEISHFRPCHKLQSGGGRYHQGSGIEPKRTSFQSPWQNGIAERWLGNCRRDLLAHVIVLNQRHLKRLMSEYICYYHEDRTHLALSKGTPAGREVETHSPVNCRAFPCPGLAGCIIAIPEQPESQF